MAYLGTMVIFRKNWIEHFQSSSCFARPLVHLQHFEALAEHFSITKLLRSTPGQTARAVTLCSYFDGWLSSRKVSWTTMQMLCIDRIWNLCMTRATQLLACSTMQMPMDFFQRKDATSRSTLKLLASSMGMQRLRSKASMTHSICGGWNPRYTFWDMYH